jgi:diguanylate cyclase (GGDEF)-like protein
MERVIKSLRDEVPELTRLWADAIRDEPGLTHLSQEALSEEFQARATETIQIALARLDAGEKISRADLDQVGLEVATTLGFVSDIPIEEVVSGLNLLRICVWSKLEQRLRASDLSPEQTFLVAHNLSNIMNAVSGAVTNEYVSLHRRREAEQRRRERELLIRDSATGVYNMRHLMHVLDREIERAGRYNRPLCVLMVDCDDLKPVNDTYGHVHGDRLILKIVRLLKKGVRKYDVIARYGGDEFLVLLPETDKEKANVIAERLRESVEQQVFTVGLTPVPTSVSIGIASMPLDSTDSSELVLFADNAMYASKRAGKNKVTSFGPDTRVLDT